MSGSDSTLSEISQSRKDKYSMIHLHEVSRVVKFLGTEGRMLVARSWWGWGGVRSYRLMGTVLQFCKINPVLEVDGCDDGKTA